MERSGDGRRRLAERAWLVGLLVVAVYAVLQLTAGSQWSLYPDSYRYARAAEQFAGDSRTQAHHAALSAFCATRADVAKATANLSPTPDGKLPAGSMTYRQCEARWANATDITTDDPRYQAIFSSRPGYPLLAAPFVRALGVARGMRALGLLTTAGASLMVIGLLRSVGLPAPAAVCGQLVFLATPLAVWSLQALTEGLVTGCALGMVWGAVLIARSAGPAPARARPVAGAALLLGSLAVCAVTRYSTALVLAAFLAVAAGAVWCGVRGMRHRGTLLLAGLAAGAAAVTAVVISALALPSTQTTLQDTFTVHFRHPEVPDPWRRLAGLDERFWWHWIGAQAQSPVFLVTTLLAAVALWRYGRGLGWFALAVAATGLLQIVVHPLVQEADRLGVLMWVPAVLGLPLLVARALDRSGRRADTPAGLGRSGTPGAGPGPRELPIVNDEWLANEAN